MDEKEQIATKCAALCDMESDGEGYLKAVFATLNTRDKDGDIVHTGAIGNQDVLISAFQHQSWKGALPVGKGRVYEEGNKAIFEGNFNMKLQSGHDTYHAIQFAPERTEFSWGFNVLEYTWEKDDDYWLIMNIFKTKIYEVSPVLVGAGVDTGVLEMKSRHGRAEVFGEAQQGNAEPHIEEVKAKLLLATLRPRA